MKKVIILSVLFATPAFANEPDLSRDEVFDCVATSQEIESSGERLDRDLQELKNIDKQISSAHTSADIWEVNVNMAQANLRTCQTQYFCNQAANSERNAVANYNAIADRINRLVAEYERKNNSYNRRVDSHNSKVQRSKRQCDNKTMRAQDAKDACNNKGDVPFCASMNLR